MKEATLAFLLVGVLISPSTLTFAQTVQLSPRLGAPCLHDPSEQPADQLRREQALRFAQLVNRAEHPSFGPRLSPYLPLDQLRNLPPTPSGFQVQLDTDGRTYTFSLKDTLDLCRFAIFSDQDSRIYQAVPTTGGTEFRPLVLP